MGSRDSWSCRAVSICRRVIKGWSVEAVGRSLPGASAACPGGVLFSGTQITRVSVLLSLNFWRGVDIDTRCRSALQERAVRGVTAAAFPSVRRGGFRAKSSRRCRAGNAQTRRPGPAAPGAHSSAAAARAPFGNRRFWHLLVCAGARTPPPRTGAITGCGTSTKVCDPKSLWQPDGEAGVTAGTRPMAQGRWDRDDGTGPMGQAGTTGQLLPGAIWEHSRLNTCYV